MVVGWDGFSGQSMLTPSPVPEVSHRINVRYLDIYFMPLKTIFSIDLSPETHVSQIFRTTAFRALLWRCGIINCNENCELRDHPKCQSAPELAVPQKSFSSKRQSVFILTSNFNSYLRILVILVINLLHSVRILHWSQFFS